MNGRRAYVVLRCVLVAAALAGSWAALAQGTELSPQAKQRDANANGVIDRGEAGGPLKAAFDEIDCDRSGTLDGAEIRGFFSGAGCPAAAAEPAAKPEAAPAAKTAEEGSAKAEPGGSAAPARAVRVDEVIREPLSQTYPVLGRLVARRSGDVAARINGAVSEMNVDVGDRVKEGDVLARLAVDRLTAERDKYAAAIRTREAMIRTAEAELRKSEQELKRIEGLKSSAAFSRARFEDLTSDMEARRAALLERQSQLVEAKAELTRAEIDLHNATVFAPYSGIITETHTQVGAYVGVGARVVSLINDTDIEIEAEVPTDRIVGLQTGTPVRLRLDDGTEHRATVRAVVPQENPRTRTRPVRFSPTFVATEKPLAVNQSVTVQVPVGRVRDVVTVHKDAIVRRGDKAVVYVVRRGRAFPRDIRIGEAVGGRFVVAGGLEPGDVVVTHGNETLPPGSAVEIYDEGAAGAQKPVGQ